MSAYHPKFLLARITSPSTKRWLRREQLITCLFMAVKNRDINMAHGDYDSVLRFVQARPEMFGYTHRLCFAQSHT